MKIEILKISKNSTVSHVNTDTTTHIERQFKKQ